MKEAQWIKCWAAVESMATSKETVETSLKQMISSIQTQGYLKVESHKVGEIMKMEKPPANVKEAWSQILEMEFVVKDLKSLARFVLLYGPSALEVKEPKKYDLSMGEIQDLANDLASFVHKLQAQGKLIVMIAPEKKE